MAKVSVRDKWNNIPITVKVSIAYAVSSIFHRCLSFFTLPVFTRLLTQHQYGQLSVYSSWMSLLTVILTLQLPYGSFSTAMVKFEDRRDRYLSAVQGLCIVLAAIFLAIYVPLRKWFNIAFELPTGIMIFMVLEILANAGIAFWTGKKRFEYKYKAVILVTILCSIVSPILQYVVVINSEEKGYARIVTNAVVNILVGGSIFAIGMFKGKHFFDKEFWKYALGFNIPLLAYYLSQMIFNSSDRIMISHLCGTDKAATYGVAYNLAMVLGFVLSSINSSYVPWYYEKLKAGKQRENRAVANAISIFLSVILLAIIWFAPEAIRILAGEAYLEAVWIVAPVAMSLLLLYYAQLPINIEFYFERKRELVFSSIGAAAMNIVLNAWLIPIWGYYVAGYTTLVSYVIFAVSNYFAMKMILKKKQIAESGIDTKSLLLILGAFMVVGFGGMALYDYLIIRIVIAVIVVVVLAINYKIFLKYWKIIKNKNE